MRSILFDTDFSADVDDLNDLSYLCAAHKLGLCDLLAVTVCTSNTKAPGAVSAALKYWGLSGQDGWTKPGVPIGCWKGAAIDPAGPGEWVPAVYDGFDRNGVDLASTVADATAIMRQALVSVTGKSLWIVAVGPFPNIKALAESPADGISDLTGTELLSAKCAGAHFAAGHFITSGEYIVSDTTPEHNANAGNTLGFQIAAFHATRAWPTDTPIYWNGMAEGDSPIVGYNCTDKPAGNLLKVAHDTHGSAGSGRPWWGVLACHAAVHGLGDFTTFRGKVIPDFIGHTGYWPYRNGPAYFIRKNKTDAYFKAFANSYIDADPDASPFVV
jgi:hypothetical protein